MSTKTARIGVRLSPQLLARLRREAEAQGYLNISEFVRDVLRKALKIENPSEGREEG